jgi:uncharacterized membrane protein YczE
VPWKWVLACVSVLVEHNICDSHNGGRRTQNSEKPAQEVTLNAVIEPFAPAKLDAMAFSATALLLPVPHGRDLVVRLARLFLGLTLFGLGAGMMVRSELGLSPWNAFHQGVSELIGISMGKVVILTGLAVLLLWIPLRQRMGLGTLANTMWIGLTIDFFLGVTPEIENVAIQIGLMLGGVIAIAIGSGFYIGAGLGPGPRDGIMTGLARRGLSIRSARTIVEATALTIGVLLGGQAGIGTIVFLFGIGPLVQIFLRLLSFEKTDYSAASTRKASITE